MAITATRNSNTLHISGAETDATILTAKNVILIGVLVSAGSGAEQVTFKDVTTSATKIHFHCSANTTDYYDLSNCPIVFPNGIVVTTNNADTNVTLIISEGRA